MLQEFHVLQLYLAVITPKMGEAYGRKAIAEPCGAYGASHSDAHTHIHDNYLHPT